MEAFLNFFEIATWTRETFLIARLAVRSRSPMSAPTSQALTETSSEQVSELHSSTIAPSISLPMRD
jgi:hypothetical protein